VRSAFLDPLPAGVKALLVSFSEAYQASVGLWRRNGSSWERLYPEPPDRRGTGQPAAADPEPGDGLLRTLVVEGGSAELLLELPAGSAEPAAVDFLVTALTRALRTELEAKAAARELGERYEEINLLYSISEILGSVLSMEEAASRILTEVADVLGARRASLWLYRREDQRLHLAAGVGMGEARPPIPVDDPESATAYVFRERQSVNLEQGAVLPLATRLEPEPRGREPFLSVPVSFTPPDGASRTIGVITLVGRRAGIRFSAGDARLLAAIATQVGAALEAQRLLQETLRRERLVRELELAHDLQLKLLPSTNQFDGSAEVEARCVPADSVGGDFYHLFRLPNGRLGVLIADVSSHGFSAALIMALAMSAVAIYAQEGGPPAAVLRRLHEALATELETTEMYMTIFYGVLDPAGGELAYANAGHPFAFAVRADGRVDRLGATNPPLGIVPLAEYGESTTTWERGRDLLCLFTDGLPDALAGSGAEPGEKRLLDLVVKHRERPPGEILPLLFELAARTTSGSPPDDRTALLVRA
jgi:phosphoserine phosphatase RsbU/P